MSVPTWSDTLPAYPLKDGLADTHMDGVLRTEMDSGPAKTRTRFTAVPRFLTYQFYMTPTEKIACRALYDTLGGTLPFYITDPDTAGVLTCTFIEPPSFMIDGLGYRATVRLEVAP